MRQLWTPLCNDLKIEFPIFGFAHDVNVVAAITNSGGYEFTERPGDFHMKSKKS